MSDLISRQAAIDIVNKYDKSHMILWGKPMVGAASIVIELEELPPVQPEQRWIPCSERLPEERGLYLTTTKDKAVYCDYWNEDNFERTEMVIAWMPLPEPYKEGEHETDRR